MKGDENKWNKKTISNLVLFSILYYAFYLMYAIVLLPVFHPPYWITAVISIPGLYIVLQWYCVAIALKIKRKRPWP